MIKRDQARIASSVAAAGVALIALVAAAGPEPSKGVNTSSPEVAIRAGLDSARKRLVDHLADVKGRTGSPAEFLARLDADLSAVSASEMESLTTPDDWGQVALVAQLDESLVDQLVDATYVPAAGARGAAALLFTSSADQTMQPLAVYVPASYDPKIAAPLILVLHGQGQTENELLATPMLRSLADRTGAIFAAPYARGDSESEPVAASDVYDALAVLASSYNVDRRRVYLAGVSLGGVALFMMAPLHPERWSALLSIAGTITNDDKEAVVRAMRGKPVYLVAGADDPVIKAQYVRGAAAYLAANGVESRYYEQPQGLYTLRSLQPAIERAWRDMFSGVRNVAPESAIPTPKPMASKLY